MIYPGKAWTVVHEQWLQVQRFDATARELAFQDAVEAVLLTTQRRSRLDTAIEQMAADNYTALGTSAGLPTRHLHLDRIWVGGGDRRLAPLQAAPRSAPF